jgi:2-hydroxyglutarate dehydrogenase
VIIITITLSDPGVILFVRRGGPLHSSKAFTKFSNQVNIPRREARTCRGGDKFSQFGGHPFWLVDRLPAGLLLLMTDLRAGLYYPPTSLKSRLCLRGRDLLYRRCESYSIPFKKTGKLIVALPHQMSHLEFLHKRSASLSWPKHSEPTRTKSPVCATELISGSQARQLEPDLSQDISGALLVPITGIVDSHAFLESLEKDIIESENAQLVYNTSVVRVDPYVPPANDHSTTGWVVQLQTKHGVRDADTDALLARNLITCTGLAGPHILNALLPPSAWISTFYARGTYMSYQGPGVQNVKRLLYPCPDIVPKKSFQSLGTHLTLDLAGRVKFGPDLEWIEPLHDASDDSEAPEFWKNFLAPSTDRITSVHATVKSYLPNISKSGIQPDYVGIRPKLCGPDGGFVDFTIRTHSFGMGGASGRRGPGRADGILISVLGIESPGLTASLGIAEFVEEVLNGNE